MPPLDYYDEENLSLSSSIDHLFETNRLEHPQAPTIPVSRSPRLNDGPPHPDLQHYQVLEQSAALSLLHDPQTQAYQVYEHPTETPFCTTVHWPVAYRAWLSLSRRYVHKNGPSPLENLSLHELQGWISRNQDSSEFGQLLYSCDRRFRGVLQYSVRLSDTVAMLWGPATDPGFSLGSFILEKVSRRRHRLAKWVEGQPQKEIANALHRSLELFHHHWSFDLYQFNSEHWARLVATGQCCSFQRDNLFAYWQGQSQEAGCFSATRPPDIWEINPEAQAMLKLAIAP
ncbi:MAG: hypothetical protein WCD18_14155 [Thermosynechococcaceae cyanobacterium]